MEPTLPLGLPAPRTGNRLLELLARGFRFRGRHLLLLFVLNLGISALASLEDERPFLHPFISVQTTGIAIAYWVKCFSPWNARRPMATLALAVAIGTICGVSLTMAIKLAAGLYTIDYYTGNAAHFALSTLYAGFVGMIVSALVVNQFREARNREALRQAEAEHLLLSRQAVEAELKLMQAQVEPHFLFNTLSNVQFLVETDPAAAARMLGHLTDYLRAAIPQLRQHTTTLAQEARLAESYLAILQMRMGRRLRYRVDVAPELGECEIPPMMLLSLVENAIQHGVEPCAQAGEVHVSAERRGGELHIVVRDTGQGLAGTPGAGVGLSSIRERLQAIYRGAARISLEENPGGGAIATLCLPQARRG